MTPVYNKANLGQGVAFQYSWKWEIYSYSLRNPLEKISKPDTAMPSFRSRIPLRLLFYPSSQSVSNDVLFQRRHWIHREEWQWQQNQTRQLTRVEDPESWLSHQDKSSVSLARHCHILFIKWSRISSFMFDKTQYSANFFCISQTVWVKTNEESQTHTYYEKSSKPSLSCLVSGSSRQ